jgi:predicted Zn-dependent peptidase
LDDLFSRIDSVTAEEVQAVARELFPQERLTTLMFT